MTTIKQPVFKRGLNAQLVRKNPHSVFYSDIHFITLFSGTILTLICFLLKVSILLAIELIWNLCEVLFIDAAPG